MPAATVGVVMWVLVGPSTTTSVTVATIIQSSVALANTCFLGQGQLGPFLMQILNKGHIKVITAIVVGLEVARGSTSNTSNIELLIDLVVCDLIH